MTTAPERPRVLGRQLRAARELVGLQPGDVDRQLHLSDGTVEKWESESDQPSADDLSELAEIYGRSPDFFLKPTPDTPTHVNFRLASRNSLDQLSTQTRAAIAQFEELCRWQQELERLVGLERHNQLPNYSHQRDPDDVAWEERNRLSITGAVRRPRERLENEGIRVFELAIPGEEFAGFSWLSEHYGPCVLINGSDAAGRRSFTLLHEYWHLLTDRGATLCDLGEGSREERNANRFAAAFLMPAEDVKSKAIENGLGNEEPSTEQLAALANRYNVSLEAIGRRLEELGIIPKGTVDRRLLEWQGYTPFRRRAKRPGWRRKLGEPFVRTAFSAYEKKLISLSRVAELLGIEIRKAQDALRKEVRDREMG